MTNMLDYTDRAIKTIGERIENSLGGNVDIVNDKKEKKFTVVWKKNDKTVYAAQFGKVYSYKELEELSDPSALVMDFIKAYTNPEEAKSLEVEEVEEVEVEEVEVEEVKASKVVKTENPK